MTTPPTDKGVQLNEAYNAIIGFDNLFEPQYIKIPTDHFKPIRKGQELRGFFVPEEYWHLLPGNLVSLALKGEDVNEVYVGFLRDVGDNYALVDYRGRSLGDTPKTDVSEFYVLDSLQLEQATDDNKIRLLLGIGQDLEGSSEIEFFAVMVYFQCHQEDEKTPGRGLEKLRNHLAYWKEQSTPPNLERLTTYEIEQLVNAIRVSLTKIARLPDEVPHEQRLLVSRVKANRPLLIELQQRYVDELARRTSHNEPKREESATGDDVAKQPHIYVMPDVRASLINALNLYVDPKQHTALSDLIVGGINPEQPILCQCSQVCIAGIFYQQVKPYKENERGIQDNKTNIARWLCYHFRRVDDGVVKQFSYATLIKHLSGKDLGDHK